MAQTEPPLRLALTNRRCRQFWLVIGHLLALLALLLSIDLGYWLLLPLVIWGWSCWSYLRRERGGPCPDNCHATALLWSEADGWRLEYPGETRPIAPPKLLRLGQCQLVEADRELFFVPPVAGGQRLRRLM